MLPAGEIKLTKFDEIVEQFIADVLSQVDSIGKFWQQKGKQHISANATDSLTVLQEESKSKCDCQKLEEQLKQTESEFKKTSEELKQAEAEIKQAAIDKESAIKAAVEAALLD